MFARGRNILTSDIDFMYESYKNLIERVEMSYTKELNYIEDNIHSISTNDSIEYDEKRTLLSPYYDLAEGIHNEELLSRIALFVSIFSFWEKSLLLMYKFYEKEILKEKKERKEVLQVQDYLCALLDDERKQQIPKILMSQLDELRNYCAHGSLPKKRVQVIKELIKNQQIGLVEIEDKYFFSSYEGLLDALSIIRETLIFIQANHKFVEDAGNGTVHVEKALKGYEL